MVSITVLQLRFVLKKQKYADCSYVRTLISYPQLWIDDPAHLAFWLAICLLLRLVS